MHTRTHVDKGHTAPISLCVSFSREFSLSAAWTPAPCYQTFQTPKRRAPLHLHVGGGAKHISSSSFSAYAISFTMLCQQIEQYIQCYSSFLAGSETGSEGEEEWEANVEMNSDCNSEFEDELAPGATTQPTTGGAPRHTHTCSGRAGLNGFHPRWVNPPAQLLN